MRDASVPNAGTEAGGQALGSDAAGESSGAVPPGESGLALDGARRGDADRFLALGSVSPRAGIPREGNERLLAWRNGPTPSEGSEP